MNVLRYLIVLLLIGGAVAAGTPAGTEIKNRAEATYTDPSGAAQTVVSSEIVTTVLPVYDFIIAPDGASPAAPGQTVTAAAGRTVQFFYTVTNQGNLRDTVALTFAQTDADDFDLANVRVYVDENGNGILDAGEPRITELELGANASAQLIVVGTVPEGTLPDATANLNLEGVSVGAPANTDTDNWARVVASATNDGAENVAGVNLGNGDGDPDTAPSAASLTVVAQPGTRVSFALELQNTGDTSDSFTLAIPTLPASWTAALFTDADCDGEADSDAAITVVGPLDPDQNVCLVLTVTPPADAEPGQTPVTVTATSQNDPSKRDSITNIVTTESRGDDTVGVNLGNGDEDAATPPDDASISATTQPGQAVAYPLELTNTGSVTDSFALSVLGVPSGWTIDIFADENCDGEADSTDPVTGVGPLEPAENVCLVVVVTPAATATGRTPITVSATSSNDPAVSDSVTNTVVIADSGEVVAGVNLGNSDGDPNTAPIDLGLSRTTTPGNAVSYPLELQNTGDTADSFDLTLPELPTGWSAAIFVDENCDGEADREDDEDPTPVQRVGPLEPGETVCLVWVVTPAADAEAGTTPLAVTATSQNDPSKRDSVTDTLVLSRDEGNGTVGLAFGNGDRNTATPPSEAGVSLVTTPGNAVSYPLELTNAGAASDTFTLTIATLSAGWTAALFADADCDGEADTNTPLTQSGPLDPGENVCLVLTVTPAPDAEPGSTPVTVTATSKDDPSVGDSVTNTVVVQGGGGVAAGVAIGNSDGDPDTRPDDGQNVVRVTPGALATYPLELRNTGDAPDTFDLSVASLPTGWRALIFSDSNCDGTPDSGDPITAAGPLEPGETVCLVVSVTPPADAAPGQTPVTVTAISQNDPSVRDSVTTTVVVEDDDSGRAAEATIVLNKTVSPGGSVTPGTTLTYTVVATNTGDALATAVSVSDALPADTEFVSASVSTTLGGEALYSEDGSSWSATPPTLAPGESLYVGVDTNGDATLSDADTFGPNETLTLTLNVQVTGGTSVSNQALARYHDETTAAKTASSETVTTPVDTSADTPVPPARCAASVTPDGTRGTPGQAVQARPGRTVYLPYTLRNTGENLGDAGSTFVLSADTVTGEVENLRIIVDANANGRLDENEKPSTRVTLAEGESAALLLEVTLSQTPGTRLVNLAAACAEDGTGDEAEDRENVSQIDVPALSLEPPQKTASPPAGTALYAGAAVSYQISFTAPEEPLTNVAVRDVVDLELALPTEYTTGTVTDPATGLSAEAVATLAGRTLTWTFAEVPAGMTVTLDVQTQVADDAAVTETVDNTACVSATGTADVCSAPVTHTLAPLELNLSKTALSQTATVGDTLTYELVATNASGSVPVTEGVLTDTLPAGLEYVPGSATQVTETGSSNPFEPVQTGQTLRWSLPELPPATSLTLQFDTRVLPAALGQEELQNRADLTALGRDGGIVASEGAEAAVEVEAGIFRTRSVLLGHLYLDDDGSGNFNRGDRPVAAARLYLSNGLSVVSDAFGRYTITDLPAGLLALRLDPTTVRRLRLSRNERTSAKDGLWRVRLQPGLLTRQDIGFLPPSAKPKQHLVKNAANPAARAAALAPNTMAPNLTAPNSTLPASPVETLSGVNIISPAPVTLLRGRSSVPVIVETPLGDVVNLSVNGQLIPSSLLGKRVLDEARGRQRFEYAGVRFDPGESDIVVTSQPAGGAVTEANVTLATAGPPERIVIRPVSELSADSAAPLEFVLQLKDTNGYAPQDAFVTLTLDGAEFASADANQRALGMQVITREGRARFALKPLPVPATIAVHAELGALESKQDFAVHSAQRPWVAAAAGSVGASLAPGQSLTAAEFGVSGTLFARGSLYGQLLTLGARYPQAVYGDVDDPFKVLPNERLIEPEVVTGSSIDPTAETRSRDRFFVRLENDLSFVQYGDFATDLLGPLLGGARELTGLSGRYARFDGGFEARGYASYQPQGEEVIDRDVPSNGTSLYRLPVGLESLVVFAVTKDDFGTLASQAELVRGADYTYTPATGQLLLNEPLPLQNSLGDRTFLRLSYRFPATVGAPRVLEAGAQVAYAAGDLKPRLGAAQSQAGATTARAVSAGITLEHGELTAAADVAYGGDESSSGLAATAQVSLSGEQLAAEATYRYTAPGYRSPALGVSSSAGHDASFGVSYNVTDALNLSASGTAAQTLSVVGRDLNVSADVLGRYRVGAQAALGTVVLGSSPELQFGAELDTSLGSDKNDWVPRALAGFRVQAPLGLPDAEVSVLHRQGLLSTLPSETDFGVRYRLLDNLSLSVTERLTWGLESNVLVGLETGFDNASLVGGSRYRGQTTLSTQYELPGGVSADAGRARLGLRTQYPLSDTWSIDGSLEHILDFSDGSSRSAASFGTVYNTDDVDAQASYQFSLESGLSRQLLSAGTNFRLSDQLFGGVNALYSLEPGAEGVPQGFSFNLAGAYRGAIIDVLTSHTGLFGSLAPDGAQLTGDLRAAVPLGRLLDLRGSYLYRSEAVTGLRDVSALGVGVQPWSGGSVALYGQLFHLWQPEPDTFLPGASLELSQRVFCGLYAVGGYNYGGLADPLGPGYGGEGFFIRVDLVADERFSCGGADQ